MKKIAIIYHSGVGNTRKVSRKIFDTTKQKFDVELYSVEKLPHKFDINNYDGLVIGFPTIHTHPSKRILKFIDDIEKIKEPKPTYIFTTCGWYSANTLRIFAKKCINKNIIPVIHRVFWGCPATDGSLLVPSIKTFFKFPKKLDKNITVDINNFISIIEKKN